MTEAVLKYRKVNMQKLLGYGFAESGDGYTYSVDLLEGQMRLSVKVDRDGKVYTEVCDIAAGEEYVLHRVAGAVGAFVGRVKEEYEAVLADISEKCFEPDVFKSSDARAVIEYARSTYGDELEFLWKRTPENAVLRRKDTGKWYAALLVLSRRKLGFDSDEVIDILDLRMKPGDVESMVDGKKYLPGYHMNKKHWITICLDGTVPTDEIYGRINDSYKLARK